MSRRNSREGKALRRAERKACPGQPRELPLVEVTPGSEVLRAATAGETLPCGCDAHDLMNGEWYTFDELDG